MVSQDLSHCKQMDEGVLRYSRLCHAVSRRTQKRGNVKVKNSGDFLFNLPHRIELKMKTMK